MASTQPDWIQIERATGFPCWRLTDWAYYGPEDDTCNNGGVNCYFKTLDENGAFVLSQKLVWSTAEEAAVLELNQPAGYCYDNQGHEVKYGLAVQMTADSSFSPGPPPGRGESGPYSAQIVGNSDIVRGMGLPLRRHVQYTFTFQLQTEGDEPEPPTPETGEWIIKKQTPTRIVLVKRGE